MAEYQPQNILVTGGAGFIGCNYIRYMLTKYKNISIVNLDKLTYAGSLDNLADLPDPSRHQFIRGDICDQLMVASGNIKSIPLCILLQKVMLTARSLVRLPL